MAELNEGEVYEDPHTGNQYEVVDDVDTFGMPTIEAEFVTVEMRSVDDGEWVGFDYEQVRDWPKVATAAHALPDDAVDEIETRAREDWNRLAAEFGTDHETIRAIVTGDV